MAGSAVTLKLLRLLAAAALLLNACGRSVNGTDTISFNISQDPHSLNPILARSDDERQIAHLAFDMLLDADANGRQIPDLATEVPSFSNGGINRDGLAITYHLRRGVRWQDGVPFSSRDVRFTWRAIVDPRNEVPSTRGYDDIASIETPDSSTAVIHLKRRWAPAVATLFTYGTSPMPIIPAHLLEHRGALSHLAFNERPIGTGPYRLMRWERGQQLVYEANPRYFRGSPKIRRIVVAIVPNTNTDLVMLRSGQIDWSLLSPAQRLSLTGVDPIRIVYAPFAGFGALAFNCRAGNFFADRRARRATAMAIDRRKLSAGVTAGQYRVTDSDQPPFDWAFDPSVRLPAFDAHTADAELDRLGWMRDATGMREMSGRPLRLTFAVFPESDTAVRTAIYVQEMLRLRGIDVVIKRVSLAQFYLPAAAGGLLMSGKFDLAYFAWRSGEDPDDSDLVSCGASANYSSRRNSRLDGIERAALRIPDRLQRKALYARVQQILANDLPYDFLYAPRYGYGVREGISGVWPTPYSPTWNSYQWSRARPP
jgi:peptide/nickel transport system substrate-binding protein